MTAEAEQGYGIPTQCGGALCPLPRGGQEWCSQSRTGANDAGGCQLVGNGGLDAQQPSIHLEGMRGATSGAVGCQTRCGSIRQGSPKTIVRKHEDQHDGVR
jgi:hypothetical protein